MGKFYQKVANALDSLKRVQPEELGASRKDAMVKQFEDRWLYLDHILHRAAHALDPEHQTQSWHTDTYITDALEDVIARYYGDDTEAIAAAERQIEEYRTRQGRFARPACVANMQLMSSWSWWAKYGGHCPELQAVAMEILSLVCGACSCERSWSAFSFIHTKKRNKLSAAKAEELVYVFSNLRLIRKLTEAGSKEVFYAWKEAEDSAQVAASLERAVGSAAKMPSTLLGKRFRSDETSDEELEDSDSEDEDEEDEGDDRE